MTRVVACPDAALGAGDPTRRWGVFCSDGVVRWPGVTTLEAEALIAGLSDRAAAPDDVLVQVELGVALTGGAGPYLVGADGVLVLVVGRHPALDGAHVAMGQSGQDRARIGVVRPARFAGGWSWSARAEVPGTARIAALDALAAVEGDDGLRAWAARANSAGIP
jgi:hypothetical protein